MKQWAVWEALKKQGVNKIIGRVLQDMYNKTAAYVRMEKVGEEFEIQKEEK